MNCPALEQAPLGSSELSVIRGNMQMTGLWEAEPKQRGESTRGSPGCFLAPYECFLVG